MPTACCLNMRLSDYSLTSPSSLSNSIANRTQQRQHMKEEEQGEENYSTILNQYLPSMTYSSSIPMSTRFIQQPLLLVAEECEVFDVESPCNNDKLLLPRSTRSLKRRLSLFERSRDWARRLITLHRLRRNTISNDNKVDNKSYETNRKSSTRKYSLSQASNRNQKSFDEDGYLSPTEIKKKIDNISLENRSLHRQSISKLPINPDQQLIVYSHTNSDTSQPIYRCHGPVNSSSMSQCCTCQQQKLPVSSSFSEFHKSLSVVDYIDYDVSEEVSSSKYNNNNNNDDDDHNDDDDDPLYCLKYLFNDNDHQQQNGNFLRRSSRRSTNISSISADSGYCDMPMTSSRLMPVHLISCTLIPVNVTKPESMDLHCVACTCPSKSTYFATKSERRRRKSSTHSSNSNSNRTYSRQHISLIENENNNCCSCNKMYYSTMTICPTLSLSSSTESKSILRDNMNKKDDYYCKQQLKKHLKKQRASVFKVSVAADDLTGVTRWYRPHLERDAIAQALQSADYGAFVLRNSTTHLDCYALSVKVPKFTHDSNIAHYLIEKILNNDATFYRIKGTIKQFPTLLSLLTHHSVMPEILPITLNLNETLAI